MSDGTRPSFYTLRKEGQSSALFNFLRGFAAINVVVFHLREQLFQGASSIGHPSLVLKAIYLLTSIGYEFVMAFFVLSGFLISSSVIKDMRRGNWSWGKYLFNRITRLWIVLLPALVVTIIIDMLAAAVSGQSVFYQHSLGPSSFFGNLFFLQGIIVPDYGQNGPLWSLSYEFWYYILFPCIMLIFCAKSPFTKVVYGLLSVLLAIFLGKTIMLYFLIWLLGSLLVITPTPEIVKRHIQMALSIITCAAAAVVMVFSKYIEMTHHLSSLNDTFPFEFCVGLAFFAVLYFFLHFFNERARQPRWARVSTFIAGFSYTLYLTHYPLILLVRNVLGYEHFVPSFKNALFGVGLTCIILIFAWLMSAVTEAKTDRIRSFISAKILLWNKHQQPAVPAASFDKEIT